MGEFLGATAVAPYCFWKIDIFLNLAPRFARLVIDS